MDVEYLLLVLMFRGVFCFSLFSCLLSLCISNYSVLVFSAMCHILIMHVSTSLDKNCFLPSVKITLILSYFL